MMDGATLFEMSVTGITDDRRPLIVDSFAGGGGASTGIELALGRSPDIAINHNPAALALHAANHPDTLHLSENVYRIDPLDHLAGRHIGLMWFSPDCKHFSKAKGGKPVARNIRDLAWIIPGWIERIQKSGGRVDVVMMENVEEFATWGPLIDTPKGPMPCPDSRGETFQAWRKAIRRLGGRIQHRELRGCDYGAPTIRKRLFVIIRFDGLPIVWPKPTHGDPNSKAVTSGKLLPWRTAAECIDWSLPCPSIFDTKAEIMARHGLRAVRPLADNTLARVARGLRRYVLDAERPFLVNLTHGGRIEDLAAPIRTITGAHRGEKALCCPTLVNVANGKTTGRGPNTWPPDVPTRTITSSNGFAVVAPSLVSIAHGDSGGRREYPVTDPYGVVTAGGIAHALVTPSIVRFNSGATGHPMTDPMATVTANSWIKRPGGAAPLGLLAPSLMSLKGTARRDSAATAPHPTVLAGGGHSAIIAPTLIQTGYGERAGQAPRCLDIGAPLGTVVAGGVKHAPIAAYLAQHNTGVTARDPRDPLSSVTATGSHQMPIAAFFAKYYGTGDGAATDAPMHTITTKDRMGHIEVAIDAPPFTAAHVAKARKVADLMRAHGLWAGGEFVTLTIGDAEFVIVDVGMRMLTPRELFNAQGFPPDYVIEGVWKQDGDDWRFEDFTKNVQVSCVGNSVCPPLAEALARVNCAALIEREVAA